MLGWHHNMRICCFAGEGERDLIVMRHTVGISWPDRKKEKRNIDLVVYGDKNR